MLDSAGRRFGPAELQALGSLAVTMVIMAVLLFWPAGTLAWARGWWFLLAFIALTVIAMVYLWRVNPEILPRAVASRRAAKLGRRRCHADDDRGRRHPAGWRTRRRALSLVATARLGRR